MATFRNMIEGIEENNRINDGQWSDYNISDLFDAYASDSYSDDDISEERAKAIMKRAIDTDGFSLEDDINDLCDEIWGKDAVVIPDTFLTRYK